MSDRSFIDTNVLVYAHDTGYGLKHEQARTLVERMWAERSGVLSTQVLQELYVNVRRKARRPIGRAQALRLVEDYISWEVVVNDERSIVEAIDIEERYGISFWDALIVQAADVAGVTRLYTEDLNHGQTYRGVEAYNPFVTRAGDPSVHEADP